MRRGLYTGVLVLAVGAVLVPGAHADGDPASDILAVQQLFVPADASVPSQQQLQLGALLAEAARHGYPLRVAIVASASDLGSVGALWRRPETYARFLGAELALVYRGTVLVVMPNGYGLDVTAEGTRTASGSAELPLPGRQLGRASIAAVERLSASAGVRVTPADVATQQLSRPASILPWVVFAVGLLPVALAWGLSLRRRPLSVRRRPVAGSSGR